MEPQKSPYIRDVNLPVAADQPTATATSSPHAKTELQSDIPVKAQEDAEPANNPIANQPPAAAAQPPEADQEFDQVLQDVNREVKKQSAEPTDKKSRFSLKKPDVHSGPQAAKAKSKHILPIAVAVIVAITLSFVAFSALKKSGGA
jgi:hypothetical protein